MRVFISILVGLFLFTIPACDKEATQKQTIESIQGNDNIAIQSGRDTHLTVNHITEKNTMGLLTSQIHTSN